MRIARLARALERLATLAASLSLLALMLIVTADVTMRYFFDAPFVWTRDVVALYLMPAAFFLVLPDAFRDGAMVRVEILHDLMPARARRLADALGNVAALAAFGLIGIGGILQGWEAWARAEVVAGRIPWRTWPGFALVAIGSLLLVVRLAADLARAFGPGDEAAKPPSSVSPPSEAQRAEEVA